MRILLLGEYSNLHNTLAQGLRALGHTVTVASNGDFWKNYPRDTDLARKSGKLGGVRLMARIATNLPRWQGYDVVQLINPLFVELKAQRLFPIYRYLRRHNRVMVLGAYGMDYYWVSTNICQKPLRYSDFNIGPRLRDDADAMRQRHDWLGTHKQRLNELIAEDCDAIISCLYEYQVCYEQHFPQKTRYIPLPINMQPTKDNGPKEPVNTPVNLFIGVNKQRSAYKGTDIMLEAAKEVAEHNPGKIKLTVAENVPFAQYQQMMDGADVILDQLYSYTPSMNSLTAMAKGIVCVGGGEPEHYILLKENQLRPIVNVEPTKESVVAALQQLISSPNQLNQLKAESIEYVRRHHNVMKVAKQYESLYTDLLKQLTEEKR